MPNSPGPFFAHIFYTVKDFVHVKTVPFKEYVPPSVGHAYGQLVRWDATVEDADTVLEAKITSWADLFTTDAEFNSMFFYTQSPGGPPLLQAAKNISIAGTKAIVTGEEYLAVQKTFNFLATDGDKFRMQFMEASSRNAYQKFTDYTLLIADEQAIVDEVVAMSAVWASRTGARPYIWRSMTTTLNEKIRKARRYT